MRRVLAAGPVISEFLASNSGGLQDSDGESSDWIEVYNPTSAPLDLAGWHLTDNPGDLSEWTFPTVTIAPNDYLLVFASGKDRASVGSELHTNFKLGSDGDYLALVEPDGSTIANEFTPTYPQQNSNVSYGLEFNIESFVVSGATSRIRVPVDSSLGNGWQTIAQDDSLWISGPTGVGYGTGQSGFATTFVLAQPQGQFDGAVSSLAIAKTVLNTPSQQASSRSTVSPSINFLDTGASGRFGSDLGFPGHSIDDELDNFVLSATSTITIPAAGQWSFGVNSDDGFELTLTGGGQTFTSSFAGLRGASDTIQTFNLPLAGDYSMNLITFEGNGGSSAELFATAGSKASFDSTFQLVGDVANGGLIATVPYVAGANDVVKTDVSAALKNVNSSAYIRVPFTVDDVSSIDALTLNMQYDDGFVAYINGVEVARKNAPASLAYNSAATISRPLQDIRQIESFLLDGSALTALANGDNVLAIQGLNDTAGDATFLVLPQLVGTKLLETQPSYFATPTPGAANVNAVLGITPRVTASVDAGFQTGPISVELSTAGVGAAIRYTTDGSEPTQSHGTLYSAPLAINSTTNLRAVAYQTNYITQPSITRTYLYLNDVLNQSNNGAAPAGWPSTWKNNAVDYGIDPDIRALEGDQKIKDALMSLPTWSITTDLDNLFDPTIGIYANAQQDGRDWERPAAVELINPDGSEGFQVNAGLRIRGGYSRTDDNPKHALKLFFRGEYGDSSLEYPVNGSEGTSSFEKIDLRTPNNYSWSFGGDPSNNFVAEVLARYNQRDMGQPYTRSTWIHVYIDGQYWGIYQTQERADADFAASYFGGNGSDYDVIKPESGDYRNEVTDGDAEAYTALWAQANARAADGKTPAFVDDAAYMRVQGKNTDGTDNPDYPVLLDADNLIVYMLETLRGGNLDAPISNFLGNDQPNNYFAIRDRTGRDGFKFFQHDGEHTMRNVNENRNGPWNSPNFEVGVDYFNPQWLHQQLMANEEYRLRFADTIQTAFFNNGPLSSQAMIDKVNVEAAKIDLATVAESARWGDAKRSTPLTQNDFRNAIGNLVNNYLPARNNIVLDQFRNTTLQLKDSAGNYNIPVAAPLYPSVDAPQFLIDGALQHGGIVAAGSVLDFSASLGNVYYTTDGSDPREVGGDINPDAISYSSNSTTTTAITAGAAWKYLDNNTRPVDWNSFSFNDASWPAGNAELGYGDGGEATQLSFGLNSNNKFITSYFRKNFDVDSASGLLTSSTLRLLRDDGAVVYINGVEAIRTNMPGGIITGDTLATTAVGGADESKYFEFTVDPSLFHDGTNVISVEVHQVSGNSTDLSFDAELSVTQINSSGAPLSLPASIKARLLSSTGTWSALEQADFMMPLVPASANNLRVTEVHYNPSSGPEFIEFRNVSQDAISLANVRITTGIDFDFSNSSISWLAPGELIVLTDNAGAFDSYYGANDRLGGVYGGSLSNGGEMIAIKAADGSAIQSFTYDDTGNGWHSTTDGGGPSLTVLRTSGNYNLPSNWRPSYVNGGTPGIEENDAPRDILFSGNSVLENLADVAIASLTADDPDDFETATFSLLPGGAAAQFVLVGNELRVGPVGLDYELGATRSVTVRVTDASGASFDKALTINVLDVADTSVIVNRRVAYAGATAAYGPSAIATDITALLPGQFATKNNYTNYYRGLNRIVIDIDEMEATTLTLANFEFRRGNTDDVSQFVEAPPPASIDVFPGAGIGGSSRVVITWANSDAVQGEWLETTVLAGPQTKLAQDDVFYFGNQLGDVDGAQSGALVAVDMADMVAVRDHQTLAKDSATIENDYDINRDGRANAVDILLVRNNFQAAGQLRMISLVPASTTFGVARGSFATMMAPQQDPILSSASLNNMVEQKNDTVSESQRWTPPHTVKLVTATVNSELSLQSREASDVRVQPSAVPRSSSGSTSALDTFFQMLHFEVSN